MGHVVPFKNSKMLSRGKLFTKPEYKKWMDQCVDLFESQLRSALATTDAATSTIASDRSTTLSPRQLRGWDDCWQIVRELYVTAERCEKGEEGATITIELI